MPILKFRLSASSRSVSGRSVGIIVGVEVGTAVARGVCVAVERAVDVMAGVEVGGVVDRGVCVAVGIAVGASVTGETATDNGSPLGIGVVVDTGVQEDRSRVKSATHKIVVLIRFSSSNTSSRGSSCLTAIHSYVR